MAGAGICQIAEDLPGTRQWFPDGDGGATILMYKDIADLRDKLAYILTHDAEREALARRAQAHVYAHHTYDHRAARFEDLMDDL